MTASDKTSDEVRIACEICLKEVPVNDAANPEADDYVAHFCGLECYEIWKNQDGENKVKDKKSG
mgnify:FL=1